jgi:hypothetical protein
MRYCLPAIAEAAVLLAPGGSELVAAPVVKGARLVLAILSIPAAFPEVGLYLHRGRSAWMLKWARIMSAFLSIPTLFLGS